MLFMNCLHSDSRILILCIDIVALHSQFDNGSKIMVPYLSLSDENAIEAVVQMIASIVIYTKALAGQLFFYRQSFSKLSR